MAFSIPNSGDAAFPDQAEPDSRDVEILSAGHNRTGVISGCAVTAQGVPDTTVAVASGTIAVAGVRASVTSGNVIINSGGLTQPRFDLVVANNAGTKSKVTGTEAANPVFPAIPADSVVLAAVYVPALDLVINSNQITDKRVILRDVFVDADLPSAITRDSEWNGIDYLVGSAQGGLSAEIVVGATPGGELGGSWASPTVDATHSGTSHAGVVTTHEGAADPHSGYVLESVPRWTLVKKTANEARNLTTTITNDTDLKFAMAASTRYTFRAFITGETPAAADFKWRHSGPALPGDINIVRHSIAGAATAYGGVAVDAGYSGADITLLGTGTRWMIAMEGVINNGVNAGDFVFQWAQNTSDALFTVVYAGSYIEYAVF